MKCLTLFLHAAVESEVVDWLRATEGIPGFTVSAVQGHSHATVRDPFLAVRDRVVGFVPRVRIEIVLDEDQLEPTLQGLRACLTDREGAGAWFVTDVLRAGRI